MNKTLSGLFATAKTESGTKVVEKYQVDIGIHFASEIKEIEQNFMYENCGNLYYPQTIFVKTKILPSPWTLNPTI